MREPIWCDGAGRTEGATAPTIDAKPTVWCDGCGGRIEGLPTIKFASDGTNFCTYDCWMQSVDRKELADASSI
jgi:hypothetical protein